jgi:Glycine zipper 2TM domain
MFRTFVLGAAVTLSATVALAPVEASAQSRYRDGNYGRSDGYRGDYRRYRDDRGYRGDYRRYRSRYYRPRSRINVYYGGYPSYGYGYGYGYGYPGYDYGYGGGYYPSYGYGYGRSYPRNYYGRSSYRCGSGTGGAIVGGATGALIGREIGRDGRGYRSRYRGRGNGTTGAIIGGAIGALIGREATRCK